MAENTKISWCHHSANLWHGCTQVSAGCENCYALTLSKRWGKDVWGDDKPRLQINSVWADLDKYQKLAEVANEKHRIFVGSMMDIFEKPMPLINSKGELLHYETDYLRTQLFLNIQNNYYPNLIFLFLTKRPSNINKYILPEWEENPPASIMFGTSLAEEKDKRNIEHLLKVKGKRFLSIEPQIEHIDIREYLSTGEIHHVIQGGESGHRRRPFDLDWAYSMKEQCAETKTPYFFKQIDQVYEKKFGIPEDLQIQQFPKI